MRREITISVGEGKLCLVVEGGPLSDWRKAVLMEEAGAVDGQGNLVRPLKGMEHLIKRLWPERVKAVRGEGLSPEFLGRLPDALFDDPAVKVEDLVSLFQALTGEGEEVGN